VPDTAVQSLAETLRPLRWLLAAVVLLPLLLFLGAGWVNYRWAFEEADAQLARTTDAVHEHALKVFETNELILDRIAERFGGLDWDQIATAPQIHPYLQQLAQMVPHVAVVGFISPDMRIIVTNLDRAPTQAHHHDFMAVHRPGGDDIFVSELSAGTYSGQLHFLVARYKPNSAHTADGSMIFIAIQPEYFRRFYAQGFGRDYAISIIRSDGVMLARYPDPQKEVVLAPDTGFRQSIPVHPESGSYSSYSGVDGRARLFHYHKLGAYPLYVTVGMDRATILGAWFDRMTSQLVFGLPATLALIAMTFVALRRTERARDALLRAEEEAQRREQAEASLHQAQKMEAVGQLTGGVAHDFNNLLTAVMGSLEMILNGSDDESIRKYAAGAMRAAERGARLTQQLLAFSRRQMLRPEIVNVNRLLGEFETLMQRAIGESIDFVMSLDPEVDPCRVDPAQFQSAILNLVVNARDATPAGGRVAIETRNVMLAANSENLDIGVSPGRYVMVAVTDTGVGMSADVRTQIFDPFFTTKEVGKGSGLGLSQVYGFAKQSGGQVTVESETGHGTIMRLYLPSVEVPAGQRVDAVTVRPEAGRGATVLVVEDDPEVLETVSSGVRALGYRALTAHNALEALGILRHDEPIDLLFTDIAMPGGINGVELARQARQLRQDIKVLLTSGYAAAIAEGEASEGFTVLGKPYRQTQLAETIASVLRQRG